MSTDSVHCIDIPVSSALGCKGALPLLEMHEYRKRGRVIMTMYGSSLLFSIIHLLTYPSIPLIHVKASHLCKYFMASWVGGIWDGMQVVGGR